MENNKLVDQQWVDIIAPHAPPDSSLAIMLAIIVLLVISAGIGYYLAEKKPRRRAMRMLKSLRGRKLLSGTERRLYAIDVARQLRAGLEVTRLDQVDIAVQHADEWHSFYTRLIEYCYSAIPPSLQAVEQLNVSACTWLDRAKHFHHRQSVTACDNSNGEYGHAGPD